GPISSSIGEASEGSAGNAGWRMTKGHDPGDKSQGPTEVASHRTWLLALPSSVLVPWLLSLGSCLPVSRHPRSVVELELLGVDQRPDDVLVRLALLVGVLGQVVQGALGLAAGGGAAEGGPEQLLDLRPVGAGVLGQLLGAAAGGGELALDVVRVEQHQA